MKWTYFAPLSSFSCFRLPSPEIHALYLNRKHHSHSLSSSSFIKLENVLDLTAFVVSGNAIDDDDDDDAGASPTACVQSSVLTVAMACRAQRFRFILIFMPMKERSKLNVLVFGRFDQLLWHPRERRYIRYSHHMRCRFGGMQSGFEKNLYNYWMIDSIGCMGTCN